MKDLYPSRKNTKFTIQKRLDPTVFCDMNKLNNSEKALIETYNSNGYILISNYFDKSVINKVINEINEIKSKYNSLENIIKEPNSDNIRTIFAADKFSKYISNLSEDTYLVSLIKKILDSNIYLYQNRINLKSFYSGEEWGWHSDFETWHVEDGMPRIRALSCAIFLTDNTVINGPIMVIPGSQNKYVNCGGESIKDNYQTALKKQRYGIIDKDTLKELSRDSQIVPMIGEAGSVLIFDSNIMHASSINMSNKDRDILFFVYNSVKNEPIGSYNGMTKRPNYLVNYKYKKL